ncbi:hypothetical protein [Bradyrhizobium sp. SZCCHNRI3043]|uniref:hypothetical protein n=1 Tax=Bradyrhizobium sp. SZCCHNRI3043 TaxID=3057292 RepID=UPI0028E8633E|nr:hypothetical protein [Bradyrhizobium sp. SZCCHNRI3043]
MNTEFLPSLVGQISPALCAHVVETRAAKATTRRIGRIEFIHEIKLISRTSLRSQESYFHFSEIMHHVRILPR